MSDADLLNSRMRNFLTMSCAMLALAGCQGPHAPGTSIGDSTAGETGITPPYDGIGPTETVRFTGTEPFWGGQVAGATLTYSTPEAPSGVAIAVKRFAGRGGISWSGTYDGARFVLAAAPGTCSDGMSDRTYPFTATLEVRGEQRSGCAWTDKTSFSGPENP